MGFSLTSPAPEKGDPTAKNRVWGFFGDAEQSHRQNRPQPKQPRQGNRLTTTKIASGRTYWPSRDPIEERGGVSLYGMVENRVINRTDYLGLVSIGIRSSRAKMGDCGGFGWVVDFGVTGTSHEENCGQILQDVEITKSVQKCNQKESDVKPDEVKFSEVCGKMGSGKMGSKNGVKKWGQKMGSKNGVRVQNLTEIPGPLRSVHAKESPY